MEIKDILYIGAALFFFALGSLFLEISQSLPFWKLVAGIACMVIGTNISKLSNHE